MKREDKEESSLGKSESWLSILTWISDMQPQDIYELI